MKLHPEKLHPFVWVGAVPFMLTPDKSRTVDLDALRSWLAHAIFHTDEPIAKPLRDLGVQGMAAMLRSCDKRVVTTLALAWAHKRYAQLHPYKIANDPLADHRLDFDALYVSILKAMIRKEKAGLVNFIVKYSDLDAPKRVPWKTSLQWMIPRTLLLSRQWSLFARGRAIDAQFSLPYHKYSDGTFTHHACNWDNADALARFLSAELAPKQRFNLPESIFNYLWWHKCLGIEKRDEQYRHWGWVAYDGGPQDLPKAWEEPVARYVAHVKSTPTSFESLNTRGRS